jgi:sugar/nucleoside kinase (ribokinase family)
MGAKMVLLKLGHQGAYLRSADPEILGDFGRAAPSQVPAWSDQELWSPCYQVEVVGTTGSGDATIAGFLSAILRDLSPYQALNAAVAVGACNVEAPDALGGLCSWEETLDRMQSGWTKHELRLQAPGWAWDGQNDLWIKGK